MTRISDFLLGCMYNKLPFTKEQLYEALRKMGPKNIKDPVARKNWTPELPTYFYCYVVSEFLYFYLAPYSTIPYSVKVPGDLGLHRFLLWGNSDVVDITADQFPNYEDVPYNKAKKTMFLQTGCKGPSKRARLLAEYLGFDPDKWRFPVAEKGTIFDE